jgi:hypothetical protein
VDGRDTLLNEAQKECEYCEYCEYRNDLHVLAYNLKRMMTIVGKAGLMEAISQ